MLSLTRTDMRNSVPGCPIAMVMVSLLSSCAVISPPAPAEHSVRIPPKSVKSAPASGNAGNKLTTEQVFDDSFEIKPIGGIEKDGLLIRYGLLVVPDKQGFLLRLSLVFRNLQNRPMIIRPKVLLQDASKKKFSAYGRDAFIRISSPVAGKSPDIVSRTILGRAGNEYVSEKSRVEWGDAYWLKDRYRIPAHGIAIGVMVFHGTSLELPVKLTVHTYKRKFMFTTKAPLPVVGK